MIYQYIKLAWRNLLRHRFFALLNVAGLALGMTSCLTAILIVRDQLSYDKFQPNSERVFRVNCQQADGMRLATVPYPLGSTLQNDFNVAEATVCLVRSLYKADATAADQRTLQVNGFYAGPSFFQVFGFQLEAGNAATVLSGPNTIVLTKETAEKFFKDKNPVGETLMLKGKDVYTVTGVVARPPGKSHLNFDVLASAASLDAIEQAMPPEEAGEKIINNWPNRFMSYDYVLLKPGRHKSDLDAALNVIGETRAKLGKEDKDVRFFAQNLRDIAPAPEQLANENGSGAPWFFIWGIGAFVLILTIFPALNYANLAISRALARSREVGVHKAIGAQAGDVRRLFLTESVLTALLALVLAVQLHFPLNHFVAKYFPPGARMEGLHPQGLDWVTFAVFGLLVGLLAGWLPARQLARLQPVLALRSTKAGEAPRTERFGWRALMLVGQFALSLVFLIFVATLWSQMRFMMLSDYGFQKENLLTVPLQGNKAELLISEFSKDPHVRGVAASSILLASNNLQGTSVQLERGGEPIELHDALVDENFIPVMGLQLIAGSNFPATETGGSQQRFILNEQAVKSFRFGTPAEAVGKTLWLDDTTSATVQGVVKDFHYRNLENGIAPFGLKVARVNYGLLYVRLAPGDPQTALAALGSIWKKVDHVHEFTAEFMDDSIQRAYGDVQFVGSLVSFFALLAIVLACMGLLGMVTYTVNTKVKEIGIRKVLGATSAQVTLQLSKRFMILLGVAVLLAVPVGFLLSSFFLRQFVYRISIGGLILGGSTLALILLGLLTVGVQAGRAALANPARSLQSE